MLPAMVSAQAVESPPVPLIAAPPLPPATMMEGFRYPVGSLYTLGYEDLGDVSGVSVEVREMKDAAGIRVRGVVVDISLTAPTAIHEQALIDADEIPDLLKGFDALAAITTNPTPFKSFEVRYATRGELVLIASSSRSRGILYAVEVGRIGKARRGGLTPGELHQLRTLFEVASQKLAALGPEK